MQMVTTFAGRVGRECGKVSMDVLNVHGGERGVQVGQGNDSEVGAKEFGEKGKRTNKVANEIGLTKNNPTKSPGSRINALFSSRGGCGAGIAEGALGSEVDEVFALDEGFVRVVVEGTAAVVEDVGAVLGVAREVGQPGRPRLPGAPFDLRGEVGVDREVVAEVAMGVLEGPFHPHVDGQEAQVTEGVIRVDAV